jgi:PAS domain-containing protein
MDELNLPLIAGLIAVAVLVPTVAAILWRQHRHWKSAERARDDALRGQATFVAALDTAPEGYIAWFVGNDGNPQPEQCSRRLSVLLDLARGRDATLSDVLEGFDGPSQDMLKETVQRLRDGGSGFRVGLSHAATNRRMEARGLRALDENGETLADIVWLSDITESAVAVEALTEETATLKRDAALMKIALDSIDVPVWVRDDDLSLIYCNRAYVAAVDGKSADDVVTRGREIAPRVSVREARALAAAARASAEIRKSPFHMVLDGSRRLMEVTEAPTASSPTDPANTRSVAPLLSDGTGRLTAGMAYDITRQEELETRLKREAAAQADVLERLGTAIAVFGPDTRMAFHNIGFSKLWVLDSGWLAEAPGYGAVLDAMRNQRRLPEVADFPAFKEKELARFNSLLEPLEDVLHLPDGATLRRTIAPHPMGGLLMTYEDVTDKLALERSYNTLIAVQRETIDNLDEAVAVFGGDGRLRLANPAFATLWQLNPDALRDGPPLTNVIDAFKELFDDDTVFARHRATLMAAIDTDQKRMTQQGRVVPSKGSVLEFVAVPLPDGGVLYCYNDVSAPERAVQNMRTKAEGLAATDRLKSDIAIRFFTAMTDDIERMSEAARSKNVDASTLAATARSMAEIVTDAHDLFAISPNQQSLRLDSVDVNALLRRLSRLLTPTAASRGVNLIIAEIPVGKWIVTDERRLKLAIFLLMSAAIDCGEGNAVVVATNQQGDRLSFRVSYVGRAWAEDATSRIAVEFCRRLTSGHDDALHDASDNNGRTLTWTTPVGDVPAAPKHAKA